MIELKGKYTTAKIMIDNVEQECIDQIKFFIDHPAFINPVAIMPDCHSGKGSVIGFTMPFTHKVIPNIIGVDVGCSMRAMNFGDSKNIRATLEDLDRLIRLQIPFGQEVHDNPVINMEQDFPWKEANALAEKFAQVYREKYGEIKTPKYDIRWFEKKCNQIGGGIGRIINSIGTLGGGNHFIEIGLSDQDDYWITIHTGSRNFGKRICDYWQNTAVKIHSCDSKEDIKNKIAELKENFIGKELFEKIKQFKANRPSPVDLKGCEWLEKDEATGYLFDMIFAQIYASMNRLYIGKIIQNILKAQPIDVIETTHNYIDFKDFIIRKGAVRSYIGERFILPLNMADGIFICEGKSNSDWNFSAPHGAGRVMSRKKAKQNIDINKFKLQMKGIYSTSVGIETIDEAPDAYKAINIIEEAIKPTADILNRIKPIMNMKDSQK